MTTQEYELMILMFARQRQFFGAIRETLKSRGIWTGDDEQAFLSIVHFDEEKLLGYIESVRADYIRAARSSGVSIGGASWPIP